MAKDSQTRLTIADALAQLPHNGERVIPLFEHGTLLVEVYAPQGKDTQSPHRRDEVYVVASGSGVFVTQDKRQLFGLNDLLFVPAGVAHHFEEFSEDLVLWVIFYGPDGGEADSRP
jgi:mannose-6-phosphate isomerase-like protein (cupin superfamily)